jgi:proteasome accessory factor B
MVDRVERLTNLLALLLETAEPLSLVQIAAELDGQYPDADQARRAAFERDKSALRQIGVPITTEVVAGGPYAGQTRYRIERARYELADLELAPDEVRALQLAAAAVHTGSAATKHAIWKLGGTIGHGDDRPPVSAVLPERPELPVIRAAVASRAPIEFGYRGERRHVDPWGLLLRGGFWYVVGHDHDRAEQRTFRVDRFDGDADEIRTGPPGAFERPATFDPRTAFPVDPKELGEGIGGAVDAIVEIDGSRAAAVCREIGAGRVIERRDDGSAVLRVPATNLDAFRSWVLGLAEHAVVIGPEEVRDDVVAWLRTVADER